MKRADQRADRVVVKRAFGDGHAQHVDLEAEAHLHETGARHPVRSAPAWLSRSAVRSVSRSKRSLISCAASAAA